MGFLYFNSIGGTALKVGSVKVSTVNLARLAIEYPDEERYIEALKYYTELDLKVLDCVRHILRRNVEKGLLKNFSYGIIDFNHLYNTIGFIGVYETMKKLGFTYMDEFGNTYYSDEGCAFGKRIFDTIHEVKHEFGNHKDYQINCEQIPKQHWGSKQ